MTIAEMAHKEKLLRLRAAILDRAAWVARAEASRLEGARLAAERLATPITIVAPSGRNPQPRKSDVAAHKLALAAVAAFGLTYAQAYQMVAKAS